jgi:hypothetical protein
MFQNILLIETVLKKLLSPYNQNMLCIICLDSLTLTLIQFSGHILAISLPNQ